MNRWKLVASLFLLLLGCSVVQADNLVYPIRGIHFGVPSPSDLPDCLQFIREDLPKEGVNTLILEFNYNYQFESHPDMATSGALSKNDVKQIVQACKDGNIELIPQINCLGHQSWKSHTGRLLTQYPEFDETPGKYPNNEDIYCRSYCPLHPEVHDILFDLIDELADACEAKAFHVGMDEVFIIGDKDCPRCKNIAAAILFAREVKTLYNHLASKKRTLWMWGDRFINGQVTGIGKWEASYNKTELSIDRIPKDIVICDWHYEKAHPTAIFFALKGFPVVSCPWRKPEVALGQLQIMNTARRYTNSEIGQRLQGFVQTTWCGMANFIRAYKGQGNTQNQAANQAVQCFRALFSSLQEGNQSSVSGNGF